MSLMVKQVNDNMNLVYILPALVFIVLYIWVPRNSIRFLCIFEVYINSLVHILFCQLAFYTQPCL